MEDKNLAEIYQVKDKYMGQPITISGPSAVGKSTIGKMVADKIQVPFYDLDEEISKAAGFRTTQEVIQNLGHKKFKVIQNECLKRITEMNTGKYVMACGGEIVREGYDEQIINSNRLLIRQQTYNICLFPSKDLGESVDILFPRLNDGKRDTGVTGDTVVKFRAYIDVFSQYEELANAIIFTHLADRDEVIAAVLKVLGVSN